MVAYVIYILILIPVIYLISYAKFEWSRNKMAAAGSIIMAALTLGAPALVIFGR